MMSNSILATRANALFRNLFDRAVGARIHEKYIILVEGLIIVRLKRLTLRTIWMALGDEFFGHNRILHPRADLALDVVSAKIVGFLTD